MPHTSFKVHPVLQFKYALSGTDIKLIYNFPNMKNSFDKIHVVQ